MTSSIHKDPEVRPAPRMLPKLKTELHHLKLKEIVIINVLHINDCYLLHTTSTTNVNIKYV
jgi:hypothetical protein